MQFLAGASRVGLKKNVIDLLLPLTRHVKADGAGRERRKAALKTINNAWGPNVAQFFRDSSTSEKLLHQVAHFSGRPQTHSYVDTRRTVNEYVVNRLIARKSLPL